MFSEEAVELVVVVEVVVLDISVGGEVENDVEIIGVVVVKLVVLVVVDIELEAAHLYLPRLLLTCKRKYKV